MDEHTTQCKTCKFKDKRACMYHGYPNETMPPSCEYKIGVSAEEAQCNICTKLRAERKEVLDNLLGWSHADEGYTEIMITRSNKWWHNRFRTQIQSMRGEQ